MCSWWVFTETKKEKGRRKRKNGGKKKRSSEETSRTINDAIVQKENKVQIQPGAIEVLCISSV